MDAPWGCYCKNRHVLEIILTCWHMLVCWLGAHKPSHHHQGLFINIHLSYLKVKIISKTCLLSNLAYLNHQQILFFWFWTFLYSFSVPAPRQLTLERQLNKSILIGWTAPDCPPGQIEMYHVYVDGFLRTTVRATDKTKALVEGVDNTRVSLQP